jgi:DNA repair photolyase
LGFGAGTDFDRKIVAKINAPILLRHEFMKKSWKGDVLIFSFTSDPYIPLEAGYELTRKMSRGLPRIPESGWDYHQVGPCPS